jgi:protein-S-isoprenylcysteine O-methyltransferase Ste14
MGAILTWDRVVRFTVGLWFFFLATATAYNLFAANSFAALDSLDLARLFSKSCVLSFLALLGWLTITRLQPSKRAAGWQPRVSAVLGTNLIFVGIIFLNPRDDLPIGMHLLSATLILVGNACAVYTVAHLGRSFSIMAEARRLVTNGPYGVIRHPLYLAEQLSIIGTAVLYASPLMFALVAVQFGFQVRRMLNEEAVLAASFPEYLGYRARTARLLPGIW